MTAPTAIYGSADIARLLGVSKAAVSNYLARYASTPAPLYRTPAGRLYWDVIGLRAWHTWQLGRHRVDATIPAPNPVRSIVS